MSIKTYSLVLVLEHFQAQIEPPAFLAILVELGDRVDKWREKILAASPGAERGRVCHQIFEEEMASQDLTEVRCQSGCSYCCHWKVDATEDEVDILIQAIKNGEVKIDMEKLEEQAKHDNDSRLWQSPGENTKCIFLNQSGQCRVYDKRPLSCRKCLVDSDPIHCSEKLQKEVSPILVPEAELITSLTWSLSTGEVEPLPYLLWKKLKQTSSTRSPSP